MLTKAAICVTLLIGTLVSVPVSAQPSSQSQDPTTKPRKVKDEPKKAFKIWFVEVEPILSQAEKDAWHKMKLRRLFALFHPSSFILTRL
jgi:hypothetical protein